MLIDSKLILSGVFLLTVTGCVDKEIAECPKKYGRIGEIPLEQLDGELVKVSPELARMQADIKLMAEVTCTTGEDWISKLRELQKLQNAAKDPWNSPPIAIPDRSNAIINDAIRAIRGECAAYRSALAASAPIIEGMRLTRQEPNPIYTFVMFSEGANAYTEHEIGVFQTLADCYEVEAAAHKAGLATKACRAWDFSLSMLRQLR